MNSSKLILRNKFLLKRKKKYLGTKIFNFKPIIKLIKKHFKNKKVTIAGYYPVYYEVNILPFLKFAFKKKIRIALPVILPLNKMCYKMWNYLEPLSINNFGVLEPQNTNKQAIPDLIMVPLVAYDNHLNRLGYGKGYYDRSLRKIKKIKKNIIFLGIAHSFQKYKKIPINKYDYKLDYILTEQGIIKSN